MKEGALRKKLQEIGIPNWGSKDLMKRRHIEWLNIYNSNCDADESVRRPKRQLVKELEEWENTQGGRADNRESRIMKKDFDGSGYAKSHKSDFDDLIAQARKKRAATKSEEKKETNGIPEISLPQDTQAGPEPVVDMDRAPVEVEQPLLPSRRNESGSQGLDNHGTDVGTSQEGAKESNQRDEHLRLETAESKPALQEEVPVGLQNPLGSPSQRRIPMFTLPGDPVKEVDLSAR